MATPQQVIGVFDSNNNQLFADAEAVRALVKPVAKVMKHPLEDGTKTTDHIVFEPVEIELSVILKPATVDDTYQQIKSQYLSATTVTIVTLTDSYENMLMEGQPYDQTPEMIDTVAIGMKFSEAIFVQAQYAQLPAAAVKKKSDASTVKTGQKNPTDANTGQSSAAYSLIFGSGQ